MNKIISFGKIFAVMSELFPQFGLSYFLPRNGDVVFYDSKFYERIILILIVWIPLLIKLSKISYSKTLLVAVFIFSSFGLRNKASWQEKYKYAGVFHLLAFIIILNIINSKCSNNYCNSNTLAVVLLLVGGYVISLGRFGNINVDYVGRMLFSLGFIMVSSAIQSL